MFKFFFAYLIGKPFYKLAEQHDRHPWGFGVLGVLSYYGGSIVGTILLFIILESVSDISLDSRTEQEVGLMGIPIGLLICLFFYIYLKNKWKNNDLKSDPNILDDEMLS